MSTDKRIWSKEQIGTQSVCVGCGEEFTIKSANHKFCSYECANYVRMEKSYKREAYLIFERDGFTCAYCGKSSYEDCAKLTVDHIIPRSRGGGNVAGNLVTSCGLCNSTKCATELRLKLRDKILKQVDKRNIKYGIYPNLTIKVQGQSR